MSQPTPYVPSYSFTQYQTTNPSTPLPAPNLDNELFQISTSVGELCTNLALIQRDDGLLANATVGLDQLMPSVALTTGVAQQWLTATQYGLSQFVIQTGNVYKCAIAHTSGNFATDLAAGKWVVLTGASSAAMAPVLSAATLAAARTAMGLGAAAVEGLSGAIVNSGGSLTIGTNAATNAMLAQMATLTIKGNNTGGTANSLDLTVNQVAAMLYNTLGQQAPNFRNNQMAVAGRGASGTAVTGQDNYTLDGHNVIVTGANCPWSQGTTYGLPAYGTLSNYLTITGATSNSDVLLRERFAGADAGKYAGQTCIVQLTFTNNSGSAIAPLLSANYANAIDNWSTKTAFLAATAMTSISGFGTAAYALAVDSHAYQGMELNFDFGALNNNSKSVNITGLDVQIAPWATVGVIASPPPVRVADEIADRMRNYGYLPSFGEETGIIGIGEATSTSAIGFWIKFPVPCRKAPTALTVVTIGDLEITDMAGADVVALASLVFGNADKQGAFVTATMAGTPLTTAKSYQLRVKTALAGNLIFTGAEL